MDTERTTSLFTTASIVISVVFPSLASFVVALRLFVKHRQRQSLYWEDWTIIACVLLCWAISIDIWIFAPIVGINMTRIPQRDAALTISKFLWVNEMPFSIVLGLVKISILLFYARLFSASLFKQVSWAMIIIITMWTIAILLVSIFKTNPVSGIWTNPEETYAINDSAYVISVAAMSLAFDCIILIMPIFVIRKLQMPLRRKIGVMLVFWLGALCCVCGAARLRLSYESVHDYTSSLNEYYKLNQAHIWAQLEPNVSVVAASLPMLRPLFSTDQGGIGSWLSSKFSVFRFRSSSNTEISTGNSKRFGNLGSVVGYARSPGDTESTRELNGIISVRHDIELGYYEVPR
ncbi:hypothetical protein BS50DRAFT_47370 [Corynespora cassiicola Philippines]|uniref:Rhodopsin domain-containing protein n=1 Tax=Corynespora cassiicola Philippines TaxID=1448308 RepID=A0A2T2NHT5_CORCC|nr:hypothetical protein BS50DRAFT_47370 [Corynespora cassiicola Philippines]